MATTQFSKHGQTGQHEFDLFSVLLDDSCGIEGDYSIIARSALKKPATFCQAGAGDHNDRARRLSTTCFNRSTGDEFIFQHSPDALTNISHPAARASGCQTMASAGSPIKHLPTAGQPIHGSESALRTPAPACAPAMHPLANGCGPNGQPPTHTLAATTASSSPVEYPDGGAGSLQTGELPAAPMMAPGPEGRGPPPYGASYGGMTYGWLPPAAARPARSSGVAGAVGEVVSAPAGTHTKGPLSPSSSSGAPSMDAASTVPRAASYHHMPYPPSAYHPHPHAHPHPYPHLNPHAHPYHRHTAAKRYGWADPYVSPMPGYMPYAWPVPYQHASIARASSWHHGFLRPERPGSSSAAATAARIPDSVSGPYGYGPAGGGPYGPGHCRSYSSTADGIVGTRSSLSMSLHSAPVRHVLHHAMPPDAQSPLPPSRCGTPPSAAAAAADDGSVVYDGNGGGGGNPAAATNPNSAASGQGGAGGVQRNLYGRWGMALPPRPYGAYSRPNSSSAAPIPPVAYPPGSARFLRSASLDSLHFLPSYDYPHSERPQFGLYGVHEDAVLDQGMAEMAENEALMLESRESFKRRRLLPGAFPQPPSQSPSPEHPSETGEQVSAARALSITTAPRSSAPLSPRLAPPLPHHMPSSPFATLQSCNSAPLLSQRPLELSSSPHALPYNHDVMAPMQLSSCHTTTATAAGAVLSTPPRHGTTTGTTATPAPSLPSAFYMQMQMQAESPTSDAGAGAGPGTALPFAAAGSGAGGAGGNDLAVTAAEGIAGASPLPDFDDSFEAFAMKLGFDDFDICMGPNDGDLADVPLQPQPPQQQVSALPEACGAECDHHHRQHHGAHQQQHQQSLRGLEPEGHATAADPWVQVSSADPDVALPPSPQQQPQHPREGDVDSAAAAAAAADIVAAAAAVASAAAATAAGAFVPPAGPIPIPISAAVPPPMPKWAVDMHHQSLSHPEHQQTSVGGLPPIDPAAAGSSKPTAASGRSGTVAGAGKASGRHRNATHRRLHGNSSRSVRLTMPLLHSNNLDQLPGPVKVTVAAPTGNSTRERGSDGNARWGSRGGGGGGSGGQRGSEEDEEATSDEEGASGGEGCGGAGAAGGTIRTSNVMGLFHVKPYLEGRKCIEHSGEMVSRSAFERAGGSMMAKWYRSIKVLPEGLSLGKWLTNNGLPVLRGNPRRSKKGVHRHLHVQQVDTDGA